MLSLICEQCEATLASPVFCSQCQALQAQAQSLDYFKLLNLEPCVDPDLEQMKASYLTEAREVHPDFNLQQQALASQLTTRLNQAYKTLKDRSSRYEYLNQLWGGASASENKSTRQDFLVEMLNLQETVASCGNCQQLENCQNQASDRIQVTLDKVAQALKKRNMSEARLGLNEINYWKTLITHTQEELKELS